MCHKFAAREPPPDIYQKRARLGIGGNAYLQPIADTSDVNASGIVGPRCGRRAISPADRAWIIGVVLNG
jgi:hypothetical protein